MYVSVPTIEVGGLSDNTLLFPPRSTSGLFDGLVYSTSPVVELKISRLEGLKKNGQKNAEFHIKLWPQEPYSIISKYQIRMPWIDTSTTGMYTIKATDEKDESAELTIQIRKVQG